MVFLYGRSRIAIQVRSVAFIVVYLLLFQILILRSPVAGALALSLGVAGVIAGLAFFMEGLFLGIMPLGEQCGLKLPGKAGKPLIVLFSLVLGMTATLAEPAIGFLKAQGGSVRAWSAPLLFLLLNRGSSLLVLAISVGVGSAVVLGVFRFLRGWSLKPLIFCIVPVLLAVTLIALGNPNLALVSGLAWDTGGITTGPVTVPLILALGIGISRILGREDEGSGGLGVVTLASALPVLAVFILSILLLPQVSPPMERTAFFSEANREKAVGVFGSEDALTKYAAEHLSPEEYAAAFGYYPEMKPADKQKISVSSVAKANILSSLKAILPLLLLLVFTLVVLLRERLKNPDELLLGIVFSIVGLFLFNFGMESGLGILGRETGEKLPSLYARDSSREIVIENFSEEDVVRAADPDGNWREFFYHESDGEPELVPFLRERYDAGSLTYRHVSERKALFGLAGDTAGRLIVVLFAFIMGFGATLAEPSLNALGITLEEITTGTYRKEFLIRTVAIGVGFGMAAGFSRILFGIPLVFILIIPYVLLLFLTLISSEDFVAIAWDSAGVTTGPITVPLVIATGIGLGQSTQTVESFGILAAASVFPVISVLISGLFIAAKRKRALLYVTDQA